jgi:short-subunit dehydrogenase
MSRILITGSADGLGLMAAQLPISQGHEVVLHARNQVRVAMPGPPRPARPMASARRT